MSHDTLRALVRDDATNGEPALALSADDVLSHGRRSLGRRRLSAAVAGLVVVALAGVAVPLVRGGASDDPARLDQATAAALREYDARLMPSLIDETVRRTVRDAAPAFEHGQVSPEDDQGQRLPARYLRYTSMWVGSYDWGSDHVLRVALLHSGSESEGDPERFCDGNVENHYSLSCTAERDTQDRPVITEVMAVRRDGKAADPAQQTWIVVRHPQRARPGTLWFQRTVEVRRGGIYLTSVTETVRAPDLAAASRAWHLSPSVLRRLAAAPALVFPAPRLGEDGCPFMLGNEDGAISCSTKAPR